MFFSRAFLVLLLTFILFTLLLPAQENNDAVPVIALSGSSTLTGQYSNRQGFGQEIPQSFLNWQLRSLINLLGIPLNAGALLSTQTQVSLQSMNYFSLHLDTRSVAGNLMLRERIPFLQYIETFEAGRTRPSYSKLMLNGIPLNGINVALRIRLFHIAFVYGNSRRTVNNSFYTPPQYSQQILFGRLGAGRKNESFFNISVLHARDNKESQSPEPGQYIRRPDTLIRQLDTFFIPLDTVPVFIKPRETLVTGADFGLAFFENKFRIYGEMLGSVFTANTNSEPIKTAIIPEWISAVHEPRLGTSASWAYNLGSELKLRNTRFTGSIRRVAPGFHSPGTPFLRQDVMSYEFRVNQSFFRRRLSIQPHYRWYRDNLSKLKARTTHTLIWGITANWRPLKLPYLSVSYSPYRQETVQEAIPYINKAKVITVSTGKNYKVKALQAFSSLTWSNQMITSSLNELETRFTGHNITLQQSLRLQIPLTLTASAGYYYFDAGQKTSVSSQISLQGNYRVREKWNATLGFRHLSQDKDRKRSGLIARMSYNFGKAGELQLNAEPVIYRDVLDPLKEYNDYSVRISFINKW